MKQLWNYILSVLVTIAGCTAVEETSRRPMETGIYKVSSQKSGHYYTIVQEDNLKLFPAKKTKAGWLADTSLSSIIHLHTTNNSERRSIKFTTSSFDLDVMTILFKYRPSTTGFPPQLNTNFNAAEFIGFRTDSYILSYDRTPLNSFEPRTNHFAYSVGGFVGLGATTMNPFVTNNSIQSDYDGVVITKGVAGLIGVGNFTFGATFGFDNLLDDQRKTWIYENKPWVGFTVGFNIN
jgi:hypothetical protein